MKLSEEKLKPLEFDFEHGGYKFSARDSDNGNSIVDISKEGQSVKCFLWPTYKIFNISAHAFDSGADLENGLRIAGSTGFGGNVYG